MKSRWLSHLKLILLLAFLAATNFSGADEEAEECEDCEDILIEIAENAKTGITFSPGASVGVEEGETNTLTASLTAQGTASWSPTSKPEKSIAKDVSVNPTSGSSSTTITVTAPDEITERYTEGEATIQALVNDSKSTRLSRVFLIFPIYPWINRAIDTGGLFIVKEGKTVSVGFTVEQGGDHTWNLAAGAYEGGQYLDTISVARLSNKSFRVSITAKFGPQVVPPQPGGTLGTIRIQTSATRPGRSRAVADGLNQIQVSVVFPKF